MIEMNYKHTLLSYILYCLQNYETENDETESEGREKERGQSC